MSAPVKNTCPDIDKAIKGIKGAIQVAQNGRKEFKGHEAGDFFWDIIYELDGLERIMEELRSDNSALRDWGHGLTDQLQTAAEEISRLEQDIEDLTPVNQ
jgi:adenine specific DNA methylase Mod